MQPQRPELCLCQASYQPDAAPRLWAKTRRGIYRVCRPDGRCGARSGTRCAQVAASKTACSVFVQNDASERGACRGSPVLCEVTSISLNLSQHCRFSVLMHVPLVHRAILRDKTTARHGNTRHAQVARDQYGFRGTSACIQICLKYLRVAGRMQVPGAGQPAPGFRNVPDPVARRRKTPPQSQLAISANRAVGSIAVLWYASWLVPWSAGAVSVRPSCSSTCRV
jgi:hypothetical protein